MQRRWYAKPGWLWLLLPLELIFRAITLLRYFFYRNGVLSSWRASVPVIVIGNISVGGTGKTPVTIALCEALQRAGFNPGVISRGYRAQPPQFPHLVSIDDSAQCSGDEPLLIARRTGCPVVIDPTRADAARKLLSLEPCDVLICDDGLQHYALQRDIEFAVIDEARGFGNGHCLPVGPLRELPQRLRRVDAVLVNGSNVNDDNKKRFGFNLSPSAFVNLQSGETLAPSEWCQRYPRAHALAGIGNPSRFFVSLRDLGCVAIEHPFSDHHGFVAGDLQFGDELPVVMTEKDAVKCAAFANQQHWYLRVDATLPDSLITALVVKLRALKV
ncbi:MAG: lpxK [Verrucomicrobiaceae bacterium]|nr:lpxK [Verrucomicrobiaceae bacterium]